MTCADVEILICDAVDGTIGVDARIALDLHLQSCSACAEFARDVQGSVNFMGRAADVVAPPDLVTRIAHQIPTAKKAGSAFGAFLGRYLRPVLQPRFVMSMAMTILSFSMLGRFAHIEPRQLKPSDLNPIKIWQNVDDSVYRGWQRGVKYYESLRLVYEIQSRLREWTEQEEEDRKAKVADAPVAPSETSPASGKGRSDKNSGSKPK